MRRQAASQGKIDMYLKIHHAPHGRVVAICDEDLVGKTLEDTKHYMKITEHFYKGEKKEEKAVLDVLKDAENINFMGREAVELGLKAKKIAPEQVKIIAGVPHAQVYA